MELTKIEKRTVMSMFLTVVLIGAVAVGVHLYEDYIQQRNEEIERAEQKQLDRTYAYGETIVLDAARDEVILSTGNVYAARFFWEGELDITVDRVRLYPDGDALLSGLDSGLEWVNDLDREWIARRREEGGESAYLLADVTIDNISASPIGHTKREMPWFNITFVKLSTAGRMAEMVGFSGMPEDGMRDYGEGSYFDLERGESASYQLVYEVDRDADPADLFLFMGSSYAPNKYRVDLGETEIVSDGGALL